MRIECDSCFLFGSGVCKSHGLTLLLPQVDRSAPCLPIRMDCVPWNWAKVDLPFLFLCHFVTEMGRAMCEIPRDNNTEAVLNVLMGAWKSTSVNTCLWGVFVWRGWYRVCLAKLRKKVVIGWLCLHADVFKRVKSSPTPGLDRFS